MGRQQHITEYAYGETVGVRAFLKTRELEAMDLSGSPVVEFIIGDEEFRRKLVTLSTANADISVEDADTGEVLISLSPSRQKPLIPDTVYRYELWTNDGTNKLLQASGQFRLRKAYGI